MMFEDLEVEGILSPSMHNIPCCMCYLLTADPDRLEWFFDGWRGEDILSIVEWTEDNQFEWALHLDLTALDNPGQEAILPFPWADTHAPEVTEGLYAWRLFVHEEI